MSCNTAGTLEFSKMEKIKIVTSKFGGKRSKADKEAIWAKCKIALGLKYKAFRQAQKALRAPCAQ